jgi:hypothetical protein
MIKKNGAMMFSPYTCRSLQLMRSIFSFEHLSHPQQTKLILHGVDPILNIKWLCSLPEDWWFGIQEILEIAVLNYLIVTLAITILVMVSNSA